LSVRVAGTFMTIVRFLRRPRVFDTTLVIVLLSPVLLGAISMIAGGKTWATLSAGFHVAGSLCLLMRRDRPILTVGLVAALDVVGIMTQSVFFTSLPSLIACYSLGRYTTGRPTLITSAAVFVVYAVDTEVFLAGTGSWPGSLFAVLVPVGIGQLVRLRTELDERGRQEAADAAVRAERRRIAWSPTTSP
jgi:hypothetical protein